ncbi:hypothetical protein [Lacticaseibacillus saniviri]|uniref:DUF4352 domain-containing protein n=1 Tax=Lacticaseibacillus saniviri JCM 17471 = DSM 24301 TaxID=1293598 RepID=A0A0R2N314_9LACO|nr:hypothetical protein [Lacticaseibacillus saniviri]KRO18784.1 hypothetical protein IV56_GL000351 [Lacticaseibacillus saniviri JCM 17471 = DSM 24301]
MKKLISTSLILISACTLAACGNSTQSSNSKKDRETISSLRKEASSLKKTQTESDSASEESNSSASNEADSVPFGETREFDSQDNTIKAKVAVISAQRITDKNEGLTADLMANYQQLKSFAIVSYKVTAITDIPAGTFDGANLTFLDSDKVKGMTSSNRDNGADGDLKAGESANYRIGVGFESASPELYVRIANVTWQGSME